MNRTKEVFTSSKVVRSSAALAAAIALAGCQNESTPQALTPNEPGITQESPNGHSTESMPASEDPEVEAGANPYDINTPEGVAYAFTKAFAEANGEEYCSLYVGDACDTTVISDAEPEPKIMPVGAEVVAVNGDTATVEVPFAEGGGVVCIKAKDFNGLWRVVGDRYTVPGDCTNF